MPIIPFIGIVVLTLLVVRLFISYLNIIMGPQLKAGGEVPTSVKISLMVPARNEAKNIKRCLEGLITQDYDPFEILVLDDHSEDHTAEIVREFAKRCGQLTFVSGKEIPAGWNGKNWACHQLSQIASGDILIFTDADNWHAPTAVARTVAWMQQQNLGVFSAFPQQITRTVPEKLMVPMIDVILYSILPLWAVRLFSAPSVAAANGQWLAFTREAYHSLGGHSAVRNEVVEDVQLARKAKENSIRVMTAAGTGVLFARMYRTFREIWEGMTKIMFGLTGYKNAVFWGAVPLIVLVDIVPYVAVWFPPYSIIAGTVVGLNGLIRGGLAFRFRHPIVLSVLLHPLSALLTLIVSVNSYWRIKTGMITWKGRKVVFTSN